MHHLLRRNLSVAFVLSLFLLGTGACTSTKNIPYFTDVPDTLKVGEYSTAISQFTEPHIRSNDVVLVSIQTLDPQTNSVIGGAITANPNQTVQNTGNSTSAPGLLVDNTGHIELPLVGRVKVSGLTTSEAREEIRKRAAVYYKDPVVNVRFANFSITVLGEVNRPGTYYVANERVTILDAIGLAGDLTIYGKRANVLLVREEDGQKRMARFDLQNSNLFQSPYYYLRPSDVLYIEPNKAKIATNDQALVRNMALLNAFITLTAVILSRINF